MSEEESNVERIPSKSNRGVQLHAVAGVTFEPGEVYLGMALVLSRLGWKVFPLLPRDKRPATAHGFLDATDDPKQIEAWWRAEPRAGIGVATGSPSGVLVLDVDPRNEGDKSLERLVIQYGPLPKTVTCQTGGGGQHYYFRAPAEVFPGAKPLPGLDIKADGGYVVVPPSFHPSGVAYRWAVKPTEGGNLADPPAWLLDLLRRGREKLAEGKPLPEVNGKVKAGRRNDTLASLAGTMRRRGMGNDAILAALLAENKSRCEPPLSEREVAVVARSISRYEPADEQPEEEAAAPPRGRALRSLDLSLLIGQPPDETRWILDGWIAQGDIVMLSGEPGIGKSWLTIDLAMAAALGERAWGHFEIETAMRVLLVDEENPGDEVHRRLWEIGRSRRLTPERTQTLAAQLIVTEPRQGFTFRSPEMHRRLLDLVARQRPGLVILDSLTALGTIKDESDAVQVRRFFHDVLAPLQALVEPHPTVLVVHHTNKAVYQVEEQVRGAGVVRGSIDMVAAPDASMALVKLRGKGANPRLVSLKPRRTRQPEDLELQIRDLVDPKTGEAVGIAPFLVQTLAHRREVPTETTEEGQIERDLRESAEAYGEPIEDAIRVAFGDDDTLTAKDLHARLLAFGVSVPRSSLWLTLRKMKAEKTEGGGWTLAQK